MDTFEYLKKYGNPATYEQDLLRLKQGEPVQYIVGNVDFYGCPIIVNPHVLIPRFETEGLVEKVIEKVQNRSNLKIVDLGTGSGCIAIALKRKLNCEMDAVDISAFALEVARKNAEINQVAITFYEGDFLEPLQDTYDVIISNPPYIAYDEEIMDIVKRNEPKLALYAEDHGLSCYKKILAKAKSHLKSNGIIAFEIGCGQGDILKEYASEFFPNEKNTVEKDLQGKDRYLFIESE